MFHIYDVSNPASPVLLKAFSIRRQVRTPPCRPMTARRSSSPRSAANGNVKIYDISNIN